VKAVLAVGARRAHGRFVLFGRMRGRKGKKCDPLMNPTKK